MIRIAFVINYIANGGPSNVIRGIMLNLDRNEYDITLITLFRENDEKICQELSSLGIHIIECKDLTRKGCLIGKTDEFNKIIVNGQYDILHTHGFIPDIMASRLKTNSKRITTIHNNLFEDYILNYGKFRGKIIIVLHLNALKRLDCCICCAESVMNAVKQKVTHILQKKMRFVRNGIGKTKPVSYLRRSDLKIPNNGRVFVYSGVLSYGKNVLGLIKDFKNARRDDEYLLVLGTGPLEEECMKEADEHVRILGFQEDPIAYYRISDIYTSASRSEGFSISVLEALDSGLGLFLSDIPSHREVMECAKSIYVGELFSAEKEDFTQKIDEIRKHLFDKRAIQIFKDNNLSAMVMTMEYEKIYHDIL